MVRTGASTLGVDPSLVGVITCVCVWGGGGGGLLVSAHAPLTPDHHAIIAQSCSSWSHRTLVEVHGAPPYLQTPFSMQLNLKHCDCFLTAGVSRRSLSSSGSVPSLESVSDPSSEPKDINSNPNWSHSILHSSKDCRSSEQCRSSGSLPPSPHIKNKQDTSSK